MKKYLINPLAAAVTLAALSVPFQANATNGYFSHGYGIKAKGMAGAGVALPQDSLAAATNPAGMVHVGNRWDVGADIFIPDRTATTAWGSNNNNPPTTSTTYDGNGSGYGESWFLIPEFGYNRMVNDNMSVGVSVFGNGGMNTTWNAPIFSAGTAPTSNSGVDLMQLFISPTIAVKIDENNSLGVALNLVYQRFEATGTSDFCQLTPPTGGPAGCSDGPTTGLADQGYSGSYGASFRIGWIGKLTNNVSAGFSFQPKTKMTAFDEYNQLFAESGDFDIPATYAMGLAWKATPKMDVAFDVQRIKYSDVASISNPNTFGATGLLGSPGGPGFGWEDMTVYKLGANFQYSKNLVIRAGWNHGEQPIPEGETLFNVLAPATVEDHLTLGFTWTMQGGAELSGFYMHAFDNDVNGTPGGTATGAGANAPGAADIGMSQHSFGVAYGKKF